MTRSAPAVAVASPRAVPGLERQTRVPDESFGGPVALERALSSGAEWIWLLAGGAIPRADALERLVEATALSDEAPPSLLAGAVGDSSGELYADLLPSPDQQHPDLAMLVGKHVLAIRNLTFANSLVARECFVRHGLPDERRYGRYAAVEWSARALRADTGYFVPSSVVSLEALPERRADIRSMTAFIRTFRADAWPRGDALHELGRSLAILERG